jgi:hypothetical protein
LLEHEVERSFERPELEVIGDARHRDALEEPLEAAQELVGPAIQVRACRRPTPALLESIEKRCDTVRRTARVNRRPLDG